MRYIIVGGGIGGTAAAIALRNAGQEPVVLEQASEANSGRRRREHHGERNEGPHLPSGPTTTSAACRCARTRWSSSALRTDTTLSRIEPRLGR